MLTFYIFNSVLITSYVNCIPSVNDAILRHRDPAKERKYPEQYSTTSALSQNVEPGDYYLKIVPDLGDRFNFSGEVTIKLWTYQKGNIITLNSDQLNIKTVTVTKGSLVIPNNYTVDRTRQLLIVQTKTELAQYLLLNLTITYDGILNDNMKGFYRSYYKDGNETKWLAATQFMPTYARMAFPCFDEPAYKAMFHISIARYEHQQVISNMEQQSTSVADSKVNNRVWTTFESTDDLPTYAVAFVVSDFHQNISNTEGNFSIWAPENAIKNCDFMLDEGQKLFRSIFEFNGVKIYLNKIDLVAMPDLNYEGTGSWGLTMYRESHLLRDAKVCSTKCKETATRIVAHELSHQWFGNLVTMEWWDYLWLNEGFATYMEYYATAEVEPSWRMDELFVVEVLHKALFSDDVDVHWGMTSSVNDSNEIENKLEISSQKGGSVLRMLQHMVSLKIFQKATRIYLKNSANWLATPKRLWDAFEKTMSKENRMLAPNINVTTVMTDWTEMPGYPLLTITRKSNGTRDDVEIQQTTYQSPRSDTFVSNKQWIVPVTCTKQSEIDFAKTEPSTWSFPDKNINFKKMVLREEWILCNIQQTGYYRVNYDDKNWQLLIKQLYDEPTEIHPLNRAQLIDDAVTLAMDNVITFSQALNLVKYLDNEYDMVPWHAALQKFSLLYSEYETTDVGPHLKNYLLKRLLNIYKNVNFHERKQDSHLTKTFRSSLLKIACELGHEECVKSCAEEYAASEKLSDIKPDVKLVVFCTMLNSDDYEKVWDQLWQLFNSTNMACEKEAVLSALGCVREQQLLKKYLFKLIDNFDKDIRPQYITHVLQSILSSVRGVTATLNFVDDVISNISEYEHSQELLIKIVHSLRNKIKSRDHLNLMEELLVNARKLDQEQYSLLISSIANVKQAAGKLIVLKENRVAELTRALAIPTASSAPSFFNFKIPTINIYTVIVATCVSTVLIGVFIILYFHSRKKNEESFVVFFTKNTVSWARFSNRPE